MRLKRIPINLFFFVLVTIAISISTVFFLTNLGNTENLFSGNDGNIEIKDVENLALGQRVETSSNADLRDILVDGQELPNASWHTSWSPPQKPARPSWVMIDLGKTQSIQRLVIVFSIAAYEGIYDVWAPPNSISIEIGESPDKTHPIEVIPPEKIPEHGAYPDKRRLEVCLKKPYQGRYVKLVFPTGGKFLSMPDVVGLGEVAIYGPELSQHKREDVTLEGDFGRVTIDVNSPQIINFFLREPDGKLAQKDLLSGHAKGF